MRRSRALTTAAILAVAIPATPLAVAAVKDVTAGPKDDGTAVTPVGWRVTPVGEQTALGSLPVNAIWSPNRNAIVVANAGGGGQSLQVVDPATRKVIQTVGGTGVSTGLAFNHAGDTLYVPAGSQNRIRVLSWDATQRRLAAVRSIGVPGSVDAVAVARDDKTLYATQSLTDSVATVDVASGRVATTHVGAHPYDIALSPDGTKAYVSNLGDRTVSVLDVREPAAANCPRRSGDILDEDFDELAPKLKPRQDEPQISDPNLLGWTHEPPAGWSIEVAAGTPQGVTEWQGWSIASLGFWAAADPGVQDRDRFTKSCGLVAVADSDEWDDKGSPSSRGRMDTTMRTAPINLPSGATRLYVNFASHYRAYAEQKGVVTATFDTGQSTELLRYDKTNADETSQENEFLSKPLDVPAGASSVRLSFHYYDAGNDWYWAVDDISITSSPAQAHEPQDAQPVLKTITTGTHPNRLLPDPQRNRLFVSNGDQDTVSVVDTDSDTVTKTISVGPTPGARAGSSPSGAALSPDGGTLYVANAGNDDVAVVDVEKGRTRGLIPTAWYPTSVLTAADGKALYAVSGKGLGAGPNNQAQVSGPDDPANYDGHPYVVNALRGSLATIPTPDDRRLADYTKQVRANHHRNGQDGEDNDGQVVPRHPGDPSPIKHVLYIVKENRTYDQVFGDLTDASGKPLGNGDPNLAIFGERVTPNQHELSRRFVTLDNFYVNSEVSAQGWSWVTQANSNYFTELKTNQAYGGAGYPYVWEGGDVTGAAGNKDTTKAFLWNALAAKKIPFRSYGFYIYVDPSEDGIRHAKDPVLDANVDHEYPTYDLGITDEQRYEIWKREFDRYVADGNLPAMQFIALPRNHTAGLAPGVETPRAMVADNDYALGKIVEAVSHSRYWKDTAIFVVEDDAQAGPDHVDAHRSPALVISPYTQIGKVDSTFYNQVAMMRTMELIVGADPLTQFDATAVPMVNSFTDDPNRTPFDAIVPEQSRTQRNGDPTTPAGLSKLEIARQPLEHPDQIDEAEFNRQIWKSVRGADAKVPAPRYGVLPAPDGDEEDGE